jgi:hypothetical protein
MQNAKCKMQKPEAAMEGSMREEQGYEAGRQEPVQPNGGHNGGLLDLLRRIVAPRQPQVLVMERDGQLRPAQTDASPPRS